MHLSQRLRILKGSIRSCELLTAAGFDHNSLEQLLINLCNAPQTKSAHSIFDRHEESCSRQEHLQQFFNTFVARQVNRSTRNDAAGLAYQIGSSCKSARFSGRSWTIMRRKACLMIRALCKYLHMVP